MGDRTIPRILLAIAALAAVVVPSFSCAQQAARREFTRDGLERIAARLHADIEAKIIPGAVLLIARDGRVVYEKTLGVRDPRVGDPMTRDAIFRIHSMTKPITSVAVMQLVEEGRIHLSEPIAKYIPELANLKVGVERPGADGKPELALVPPNRRVTIHDLLIHTAGFPYSDAGSSLVHLEYVKAKAGIDDFTSTEDMIAKVSRLPLLFHPGSAWDYGISTDILGALLERISGKPLDQYLEERVLRPLGMRDTGFWVDAARHRRMAEGFERDAQGRQVTYLDRRSRPSMLGGGGGMVSTAPDYARFLQMLLNGGTLDGVRILSPATVTLMTSEHLSGQRGPLDWLLGPGYGFGLGFAVRTDAGKAPYPGSVGDYRWLGHAGTVFWVDPKERLAVVLMVQAIGAQHRYTAVLRNTVYAAMQ